MIKSINLKNFRNHENLELTFKNNLTYIYGSNGTGKTSILESIYLISTAKSHKTSDEQNVIMNDKMFAKVEIKTDKHLFEMVISKQGKRTRIDRIDKTKLSEFIGNLHVCMFAPEDLDLIKGSPADRRKFIDIELMKINKKYLFSLNEYYKVLKQRNALLKNIKITDDNTFLNIISNQLYETAVVIYEMRNEFINNIKETFNTHYKSFSNDEVDLQYNVKNKIEDFKKHLFENQNQDILLKTTSQGPHRDDFNIIFKSFKAKAYASQGQMRLIVIALKLALLDTIIRMTKNDVVLLLDDLFSELDDFVINKLLTKLPRKNQIIITSTQKINIPDVDIINLDRGRIWVIIIMMLQIFKYLKV